MNLKTHHDQIWWNKFLSFALWSSPNLIFIQNKVWLLMVSSPLSFWNNKIVFLFFSFVSHPKLKFRKMTLLESEALFSMLLVSCKTMLQKLNAFFYVFSPFAICHTCFYWIMLELSSFSQPFIEASMWFFFILRWVQLLLGKFCNLRSK